ncbi:MAG: glucose-6-phosphate isomerase [Rhodospirillaceae bacterium]|nr:glucose-6-phosphate isomerase [Rhodospirillaceae bacterium]
MLSESYYTQDISACFASSIGSNGLEDETYQRFLDTAEKSLTAIREQHKTGSLPLLELPVKTTDLENIEAIAARYCEAFDDVVILGTGGSSLGGQSICELAPPSGTSRPQLHFMANIDSDSFDRLFQSVAPERTGFMVISKSGGTAETLTQFLYCLDVFRNKLGDAAIKNHFVVITEPGDRTLRRLAEKWELEIVDHDPGVGGRYSALSVVGLLPALIAGVDAYQIREGALSVLKPILDGAKAKECALAQGAVINVALAQERTINTTVLMPYLDRLASFGLWYRQLWAESLGKDGHGTNPVRALGTVDQHSQLQLYLDGPRDKFFTLVFADQANSGGLVPADLAEDPELAFIAGKRMGDLMAAEQQATAATLIRHNCPTRIMTIETLDEHSLGALLMHFMLETIIAADLLGVNAFDQPAVEHGKILAKKYLAGESG